MSCAFPQITLIGHLKARGRSYCDAAHAPPSPTAPSPASHPPRQDRVVRANRQSSGKRGPSMGTLAWLFDRYRETVAWNQVLSAATRHQRENILARVLLTAGNVSASAITTTHIVDGRERRSQTPAQARNFLDAMRGLFRWAVEAGHVKRDPTIGVKNPPTSQGRRVSALDRR